MIQPTKPYQIVAGTSVGNTITCHEYYSSISNLQTSVNIIYPIVFINDAGKEGFFKYDSTDTTSIDDSTNVLVTTDGKRYKRTQGQKYGKSVQSGNGILTSFTITHGLGAIPTYCNVSAGSSAASSIQYFSADSTTITVVYAIAPPDTASNLILYWEVKL
jgi:hypothetical protein